MDMNFEVPLEALDLSVRTYNSLKRMGITTVSEVLEMLDRFSDGIGGTIRNFGVSEYGELIKQLKEKGYWPDDWEDPHLGVPEPK